MVFAVIFMTAGLFFIVGSAFLNVFHHWSFKAHAGGQAIGCWLFVPGELLAHRWYSIPAAAYFLVLAVFWTVMWWKRRKNDRKKALALIGAKSKALVQALVDSVKEKRRRSPVLRPSRVPT